MLRFTDPVRFFEIIESELLVASKKISQDAGTKYEDVASEFSIEGTKSEIPITNGLTYRKDNTVSARFFVRSTSEAIQVLKTLRPAFVKDLKASKATSSGDFHVAISVNPGTMSYEIALAIPFVAKK